MKKEQIFNFNTSDHLIGELFDSIPDAIYFKDKKGRLILVNRAHAQGLGLKPEQVVGHSDYDFFPKEQARRMTADDRTVMRTASPLLDILERTTRPDGTQHYVSTTKLPRFDKKGRIVGIMGITRDITFRTKIERDRYHLLFETSQNCIFITTKDGRWVDINEAGRRLFGYRSKKELLQTPVLKFYAHPFQCKNFTREIEKKGYVKDYEIELKKKDGTIIQALVSAVIRRDEKGKIAGYQGTIVDITEKKKAEEEKEHLLCQLQQRLNRLTCLYGIEQVRLQQGLNIEKYFQEVLKLLQPTFRDPAATLLRIHFKRDLFGKDIITVRCFHPTRWVYRIPLVVNKKRVGYLEIFYRHKKLLYDKNSGEEKDFLKGIARRLGRFIEWRYVDEELQRTLNELKDIKKALDVSSIVAIIDRKGKITYVNDKFCEVSGYSRAELLNQNYQLMDAGPNPRELFAEIWKTITKGRVWKGEICSRTKKGDLYWVETVIVPFVTEKGKPFQYVCIHNEITKKKFMEEAMKKLPQRIIQAQEKEREAISREIHDDVGQSLAVLKMLIQSVFFQEDVERVIPPEVNKKILNYVDNVIQRTRELASGLRPSALEVLGLTTALETLAQQYQQRGGVLIYFKHCRLDNLQFFGEEINLYRIIQEALTNVIRHANATKAEIVMKRKKRRLHVRISDNGNGIPDFKATALRPARSGLGLSTMEERARLLGGTFQIKSRKGRGTTIYLDIPVNIRRY